MIAVCEDEPLADVVPLFEEMGEAELVVMGLCGSCPGADKGCWAPDCYIDPDTRKK